MGDSTVIRHVWSNLIGNAMKFSATRIPPRIQISGRPEGDEVHYEVRDNGVGFDMRYAHKLFGVFKRLHSTDEFPGTGVGLAIVHRIVVRHGGRIWAESSPDAGATFHFTLPSATPEQAAASGRAAAS
jgi:light-regulated signal transduction histidine kinase (bacteriophytochrome)